MENKNLPSAQDLDAAAEEQKASEQTGPRMPICPHCATVPFHPNAVPFNVENGVQLLIFFCDDCRKVINAVILEMPRPRVQQPAMRSPIIMPGRGN